MLTEFCFGRPGAETFIFSDEQFKFFEPLLGKKSLTYKNGPEARKKRQLVDRSFSHEAVSHYYEHFTQVIDMQGPCCDFQY